MDANNTQLHVLLGKADWLRCSSDRAWPAQRRTDADVLAAGQAPLNTDWDDARGELTLERRVFQFVAAPKDTPPALSDRRGTACDHYGNWYWVDRTRQTIMVNSAGTQNNSVFWDVHGNAFVTGQPRPGDFHASEAPSAPDDMRLAACAVTEDHYLVAGTTQPAGVLIFDLHSVGAPQHLLWPQAQDAPFEPADMAARPGGGVWILDARNKRYWGLDRGFNVIAAGQDEVTLRVRAPDAFQPKDADDDDPQRATSARTFPAGIRGQAAASLDRLDPIAIEALPDGTVLILDSGGGLPFSRIYRYRLDVRLGGELSTQDLCALLQEDDVAACRLMAHDFTFVPAPMEEASRQAAAVTGQRTLGSVFVVSDGGNQTFAFELHARNDQPEDWSWTPLPQYLPMQLFGGRGLIAAGGQTYYDTGGDAEIRWLPLIEQRRPRYASGATIYTPPLDGREPDCVWHRLMLDGCIPPDTEVVIASRAANHLHQLERASWNVEPAMYLRESSELPFAHMSQPSGNPTAMPVTGAGTWELLFQRARGRYVQLQLTLRGDERSTPRLRALRAYYPRFSYLSHYLPAVYREDAASASFLDRFLANFEGAFTAIEDKIAAVQMLFDVRSAPAEALDWLASWLGAALDPSWDEDRRRLFIKHAMAFYQFRGTAFGLKAALRLALDACMDESVFDLQPLDVSVGRRGGHIRIAEQIRVRAQAGEHDGATVIAHHFTVQLPVSASGQFNREEEQRRLALTRRIVALEKPAHTTFDVQFYWAMFRVGEARLGEDTLIVQGSRAPELLPPMVLGQGYLVESTLAPSHPQDVADRMVLGRGALTATGSHFTEATA